MRGVKVLGYTFLYGDIAPEYAQLLSDGTAESLVAQRKHCGRRTVCASARHAVRLEEVLRSAPQNGGGPTGRRS